jgi:hypothetical protein
MAFYLKQGKSFSVTSKDALNLHESLPVNNYTVQNNPDRGFYLQEIDMFTDIPKHYGDNCKNADRIYRTFQSRSNSTGVMLTGEKGSGKSLLAKTLSLIGYKDQVPTIVINAAWRGDAFNEFIQSIDQPTIILFDEFEKVYDAEEQEEILTLLDGVYPSKKLFVITCNDKWRVNRNMRNRPGRIFYMIDFLGLDLQFIREYCEDNLINKHLIDKVCSIANLFKDFNFDMLKALVEEMNRYNEDPTDALKILNAKPEYDGENSFTANLIVKGKHVQVRAPYNDDDEEFAWTGNPLNCTIVLNYKVWVSKKEDNYNHERVQFTSADLIKIDGSQGLYIFKNTADCILTLTKIKPKFFNYLSEF